MVKLIVDVDTGIDDAWGLFVFLSTQRKDCNILGVTCCKGNTSVDNVCKNTGYVLATAGRDEIPIFRGAESSLLQLPSQLPQDYKSYFGDNGFGDVALADIPIPCPQKENAVEALNRLVLENPGEVTLVCFAPLTNIALAVRTYPGFVKNVKDVFIMGGNYTALGNTTMCAEFNFHTDPEAAHIVLTSFEKKLTLLPWETCLNLKVPFEWRHGILSEGKSEVMSLMNTIEKPIMARALRLGYKYWISCDQLLAVIVEDPETVTKKFDAHAIVELGGHHTRGQIVIDHLQTREHNITIIESVSQKALQNRLLRLRDFFSTENNVA